MKKVIAAAAFIALSAVMAAQPKDTTITAPESPFGFGPLVMHSVPDRVFPITKYGARQGDVAATQKAFLKAMEACNKAGGGKVIVPEGVWKTGPISFRSNCELHLNEGSKVLFVDELEYFPIVRTTWGAMEVLNFSPLVYAYECENVAISGSGTLETEMDLWRTWFGRPASHLEALKKVTVMASTGIPYSERKAYEEGAKMRPLFIEFNRCTNVRCEDFKLRNSPLWCLHLFLCRDVWIHDIDIHAEGHNSDGIDVNMTQHAVIERCRLFQHDDAICFKAGRNKEGWELATPTSDIVVRDCHIECGGSFMAAGSEVSAGIRNIHVHDCTGNFMSFVTRIKTNERRGGEICNILVERCHSKTVRTIFAIDTDVMFQYRTLLPTFEVRKTLIHDIEVRDVGADWTEKVCEILGDSVEPVRSVTLKNVKAGEVTCEYSRISNVIDLKMDNITVENYSGTGEKRKSWSFN